MPKAAKTLENMAKHLTHDEIGARAEAEAAILPHRDRAMRPPLLLRGDKGALRNWRRILKDMAGYAILDLLDMDALGIYCSKLSRLEAVRERYARLMAEYDPADLANTDNAAVWKELRALSDDMQALETSLLTYAGKLGLTPSGRVTLARRRAAAVNDEPPDDLFGD